MARDWIEQGLRQTREREERQRRAAERRLHQAAVITERGPDLMRRLVAEVGAVIEEYQRKKPADGDDIEFEALPHEGFCVGRSGFPKVTLQCRPGYETHVVYCNLTRIDAHDSEAQEMVFSLAMTADDADRISLRHENTVFADVDEAVEFLLKPVLFPTLDPNV